MKKILITCICLGLAGVFAFAISWGVINFNKVKEGMSGTGVYTEQDLNKAYEDGYGNGIKDKAEYLILIDEYRNTITTLNDTISQLNFQVNTLTANNKDYEIQTENLKAQRTALQNEVAELELDKENNEATIYKLNNQIINLNKQISDLSNLTQTASSQITALNNRVNELQSSVNYYESFIAQMENGEQVVATYEVDGVVWKIEILNKGTEITFTSPASTETTIFNGWQIDGTDELLGNTYTINANTKFVADITYKHQVTFMVDEQVYDNQYVIENESAILPEIPAKEDYDFIGWSINGVDIVENIDTLSVNQNVTYVAVFKKFYTVTIVGLDSIRVEGQKIYTDYTFNDYYKDTFGGVPSKSGYTFRGWSLVDPASDAFEYSQSKFYDIDSIVEDITIYPILVFSSTKSILKSLSIPSYTVGSSRSVTAGFGNLDSSNTRVIKAYYQVSVTQYNGSSSNTYSLSQTTIKTTNIYGSQTFGGTCSVTNYKCTVNAKHSYSADDGFSLKLDYRTTQGQSSVTSANINVYLYYNVIYTGDLS